MRIEYTLSAGTLHARLLEKRRETSKMVGVVAIDWFRAGPEEEGSSPISPTIFPQVP